MRDREFRFWAGILTVQADAPDWGEVSRRLALFNESSGLSIMPKPAFLDNGTWSIPFYAVQALGGSTSDPAAAIRADLPYALGTMVRISPKDVPKEELPTLRRLVNSAFDGIDVSVRDVSPADGATGDAFATGSSGSVDDIFTGLVGLDGQRDICMKIAKLMAKRGGKALDCMHMAFVGSPGTGKTEFARRLVAYTDYLGLTDGTRKFVKVGEADLIAKYVGHTAPKVKNAVESAVGGILFIDEAYAIANAPHFGQEAVDCLVDQLDTRRHEFICIIAGYRDEIDRLFSMNAGLRDRFGFRIEFPDFSDAELAEIFNRMAKRKDYAVAPDAEDTVMKACKTLRRSEGFSNARSVRRLVDRCVLEACWSHDDDNLIRADDVLCALQCADIAGEASKRRRVGF